MRLFRATHGSLALVLDRSIEGAVPLLKRSGTRNGPGLPPF